VTLAAIWRSRKFNQQKVAWRPECAMVVAAQKAVSWGPTAARGRASL
jgi:hypothetical protein